jgi:hypothetical protein
MWHTVGGQILIEPCHFGQTATEYDDLWVEQVDDPGQRPAEPGFIALQAGFATAVTGLGAPIYLFCCELFPSLA